MASGPVTVNVPVNATIAVNAITNAAYTQNLTIVCGGKTYGPFQGSGTNKVYANFTFETGSSSTASITITANNVNEQVSPPYQFVVQSALNLIFVTTEDGNDQDWNDTICMLYWPVG